MVRRVPGWERWGWLAAGFSTRAGGVSMAYGTAEWTGGDAGEEGALNLGFTPEDAPSAVEENRQRLVAEMERGPWRLVVARQVHGTAIRELTAADVDEAMIDGRGQWPVDGLVTRETGLLLGVGAADCVPMLIADVGQRVVGAFHAGWRGTAAGMAGRGLERMQAAFGTRAADCIAAVGPSIGSCCYEVDGTVRDGFAEGPAREDVGAVLRPGSSAGRWQLDLWLANRLQLERAGVPADGITLMGECTACTREANRERRYFSHRAEGGRTGRMLGVIGIDCEADSP